MKVTHAPVARGADAVKLDRKQPATVELAAKRPFRRRDQRHVLGGRGVAYLEAVDARRQVLGPVDGVIRALALGDKPRVRNDFPRTGLAVAGSSVRDGRAGADHDGMADQRSRALRRQRIQDDFERGGVCHTAVTLAVQELGLIPGLWLEQKGPFGTYFARKHQTDVAKLSNYGKEIDGV